MTDKEKKSKIADILMDFQEEYSNEVINRPMLASLYAGNILSFIDSMQEEPVSVWHDANQQPTMYRKYLVRYSDGRVSGSWERHDDGVLPWKDVVREHKITHWCYVDDLNKTIRL